jgi:hypothetical protein
MFIQAATIAGVYKESRDSAATNSLLDHHVQYATLLIQINNAELTVNARMVSPGKFLGRIIRLRVHVSLRFAMLPTPTKSLAMTVNVSTGSLAKSHGKATRFQEHVQLHLAKSNTLICKQVQRVNAFLLTPELSGGLVQVPMALVRHAEPILDSMLILQRL